jgi:hypothetical protein
MLSDLYERIKRFVHRTSLREAIERHPAGKGIR